MKRQIRRSVFETNSSSIHSISISKKPVDISDKSIHFNIGEFGWENSTVDTADYLYTAILELDEENLLDRLKEVLDKNNIKYSFETPRYEYSRDGKSKWLDYGYIDHYGETREFVETVLNDEDMLMRLLFGDSCVYTGNDNSEADYSGKDIAEATIEGYDYKTKEWVSTPNPYHDAENYDYFYKGN